MSWRRVGRIVSRTLVIVMAEQHTAWHAEGSEDNDSLFVRRGDRDWLYSQSEVARAWQEAFGMIVVKSHLICSSEVENGYFVFTNYR